MKCPKSPLSIVIISEILIVKEVILVKKVSIAIILAVFLLIPTNVFASTQSIFVIPCLTFNGTTAICEAPVAADSMDDYIYLVARLSDENGPIITWSDSGYGYIDFYREKEVVSGNTYTLTVSVMVNGKGIGTIPPITKTCP